MGEVRVEEGSASGDNSPNDSDKTQIAVYFFGDAYTSPFDLNDMPQ